MWRTGCLRTVCTVPPLSWSWRLPGAGGRLAHHSVHPDRREDHRDDTENGGKVRQNRDAKEEVLRKPKYYERYSDYDECYGNSSTQVHPP